MTSTTTRNGARLPGPLFWHLVATTLLQCLVVIVALAVDAVAPWAAAVMLAAALAQAAHAAHTRRALVPTRDR